MIRLRPIREEEFAPWLERVEAWYAHDLERNGGFPAAGALEKARTDVEHLFPGGKSNDAQVVLVAAHDQTDEQVGVVWFAVRDLPNGRGAWLYDIDIVEGQRGRGFGRRAMELFEEEVRRRGLDRIGLNVMGGNEVARSLYRSLGYRETFVAMAKELDA